MSTQQSFEFQERPTIKGFPELRWTGKRPYKSTVYYPAQLKEVHGSEHNGWMNKIFWGDNLQVMSHLLKDFRGKIDLIYIDPPFDSKADYKKTISIRSQKIESDISSFEEKQYGDIWSNDEYLQFMYERLILMRELLSENGTLYLHCDHHKSHHLRCLLDEVFGPQNMRNEIIWCYDKWVAPSNDFQKNHDTIFRYTKSSVFCFNVLREIDEKRQLTLDRGYTTNLLANGERQLIVYKGKENEPNIKNLIASKKFTRVLYREPEGNPLKDYWQMNIIHPKAKERVDYPTQKPENLIERIILASSKPEDLVFDCFMGSGTTQAVAMKLGRRFIGADINLTSVQTTTKRLLSVANEINKNDSMNIGNTFTGFEVYNVNNYEIFRNPLEARKILLEAFEIQPFPVGTSVWDGELDGRMVKILPVNRIACKADIDEIVRNLPFAKYEAKQAEDPTEPVEKITLICMGHEQDLKAAFEQNLQPYKVDVRIVDILRDRSDLKLKREAEADVSREGNLLVVRAFYPLNLMQKLSLLEDNVEDWRQLVDSIMIDWNYDGVFNPSEIDLPAKNELVKGIYSIPETAGIIRIKFTDLLSESLEVEVK